MMKTALYQKKFKKAQNQQKLLHTLQSKAESEYYGTNTNRGIWELSIDFQWNRNKRINEDLIKKTLRENAGQKFLCYYLQSV